MGMNTKQTESGAKKESLPSRAEYHRSKYKKRAAHKSKIKISVPLILLLLLLLLPVAILSFINIGDRPNADRVDSSSGEEVLFETDETHPPKENENTKIEKEPEQETEKDEKIARQNEDSSNDEQEHKSPSKEETKEEVKNEVIKEVKKEERKIEVPPEKNNENTDQGQAQDGFIYHQVQPGETLFRIAMNYYKSQQGVDRIKQANGLSSNEISVGQTLKIPKP